MALPPQATNRRLYTDRDPLTDAEFGVRIDTLAEIDAFARGRDPRVVQVSATLAASMQEVEILRPEGTLVRDARPMTRLNVSGDRRRERPARDRQLRRRRAHRRCWA